MASTAAETNNPLIQVRELLKLKGYEVEEPQESWVWVTVERFGYVVSYSKNDSDFYRVSFPLGLKEKDSRRDEYLNAINKANSKSKLSKAYLDDDNDLNIVVDIMAPGPKEFMVDFVRAISAIQTLLNLFDDEVDL